MQFLENNQYLFYINKTELYYTHTYSLLQLLMYYLYLLNKNVKSSELDRKF